MIAERAAMDDETNVLLGTEYWSTTLSSQARRKAKQRSGRKEICGVRGFG